MSRRRVLILNTDLDRGGAPHIVREVATRLASGDTQVEVACLSGPGPVGAEIEQAGVKVTALGAKGPRDLKVIGALSRLIAQGGFDTVLSYLVHANVAAALASLRNRRVAFFHDLQNAQRRPRWHWWAEAIAARRARRIIVPSASVADCAVSRSLIRRDRIVVIPNGVDVQRFERIVHVPAEGEGEFRLGFVGRLDPIKRVPDLVEAMARLKAAETRTGAGGVAGAGRRVVLHVFGDGEDRGRIEQSIQRHGVGDRVILHGMVAEPERTYGRIDALALCSESEGFGLVLVEAMAAGVPIVATASPGIRDVVRHGRTALLSPLADPAGLAESIRRLAGDPSLREALVKEGHATALAQYSWDSVVAQYRQVLGL